MFLQCRGDSARCKARHCGHLVPHPTPPPLGTRSELEVEVRHLPAPSPFPALAVSGQCWDVVSGGNLSKNPSGHPDAEDGPWSGS